MPARRTSPICRLAALLLLALPLGGCLEPLGLALGSSLAMVPLVGRTAPDMVVSVLAGADCSLVRLDAGKPYCAPEEPPPARPLVCTRSLGTVDCWTNPEALGVPVTEVAAGARELTPAQEENRKRRWPALW